MMQQAVPLMPHPPDASAPPATTPAHAPPKPKGGRKKAGPRGGATSAPPRVAAPAPLARPTPRTDGPSAPDAPARPLPQPRVVVTKRPLGLPTEEAKTQPKQPRIASQYSGGGRGTVVVKSLAACLESDHFSLLEKWTLRHAARPYPSTQEKQQLAESCGLELESVHTWFRNMRKRKFFHLQRASRAPADAFETQLLAFMRDGSTAVTPPVGGGRDTARDTAPDVESPAPAVTVTPAPPQPPYRPRVRAPPPAQARYSAADVHAPRALAAGERRVVAAPGVGGSFGVLLDRGADCAVVAGFADEAIARATGLHVGDVVVAADQRRLAGAAWEDIVARIRCCGRAREPLELVVRPPATLEPSATAGLGALLDAIA